MNEWIWSIGGMVLTGENWSTGRETLYSVGGRWMNGYGALVEFYWQGKTEVLREKPEPAWICPPQFSHCLPRNRTLVSAVRGRRLITWYMAWSEEGSWPDLHINIESVPRSKHSVSVIKTSQLILYREIIAVCSQIHTKHINTLCGLNVDLLNVKLVVHIVTTGFYRVNVLLSSKFLSCDHILLLLNPVSWRYQSRDCTAFSQTGWT